MNDQLLAMSNETASALITTAGALLGVLVGAVLTTILEVTNQRRRDRLLARAASRLLVEELDATAALFKGVAAASSVSRSSLTDVAPSWEAYREFLAGRASDEEWLLIANAVRTGRQTQTSVLAALPKDVGMGQVPSRLAEEAGTAAEALTTAARRLEGG